MRGVDRAGTVEPGRVGDDAPVAGPDAAPATWSRPGSGAPGRPSGPTAAELGLPPALTVHAGAPAEVDRAHATPPQTAPPSATGPAASATSRLGVTGNRLSAAASRSP